MYLFLDSVEWYGGAESLTGHDVKKNRKENKKKLFSKSEENKKKLLIGYLVHELGI